MGRLRELEPKKLSRGCTAGVPGGPCKVGLVVVVVALLVSMGKFAGVFRPPEKLRLGWGEFRMGKTKPQVGWKL